MTNKYLTCESCVYYENLYGYNEKGCSLGFHASFCNSFPCTHYIEDAMHYKNRIEIKKRTKLAEIIKQNKNCTEESKNTKVKTLKERKNIREIE